MKSTVYGFQNKSNSIHPRHRRNANARRRENVRKPSAAATVDSQATLDVSTVRTNARDYENPVDYQHPFESIARLAQMLVLRYDANRTRHAYYRQIRLIHEHFGCDPAVFTRKRVYVVIKYIHCLVPGAGLNDNGKYVEVRQADFLIYLPHLQAAFRQQLYQRFQTHDWQVDPEAWKKVQIDEILIEYLDPGHGRTGSDWLWACMRTGRLRCSTSR